MYERRRQIANKFYVGIFAACLLFAWMTLTTSVIRGIANTAPFSPWSFGYYISQVMPILIIALLFSLWNVFSPDARRVGSLTAATPVNERVYYMLKCGAAFAAWFIALLFTIILGLFFLIKIFGYSVQVGELLAPCVAATLPTSIFFFGAGLMAGRLKMRQSITAVVITIAFVIIFLIIFIIIYAIIFEASISITDVVSISPISGYASLFGSRFFSEYPLTTGVLDPGFSMPFSVIAWKTIYTAAGIVFSIFSLEQKKIY